MRPATRSSRSSLAGDNSGVSGHAATAFANPQSGNIVVKPPSGGDQTGLAGHADNARAATPPDRPRRPLARRRGMGGPLQVERWAPRWDARMGAPPMGGPPGYGPSWGPHPGGVTSTGGMAMMPMGHGGYPMQPQPQGKSGSSGVLLGALLAFLLVVFGVMMVLVIKMATDTEGPVAAATGTLPSLGAPGRPRSADEVLGSLDPTKPVDAPGTLSVFCVPACDVVLVDGKPVGASPVVSAPLRPGRHVVAVSRMGAAPQQSDVFVPAGGTIAHRFWLEP